MLLRLTTIYAANVEDVSFGAGGRTRALINKRWKTEPETQRNGTRVEWNQEGIAGPNVARSNRETNGDAKFCKRVRGRAGGCVNKQARKSLEGRNWLPGISVSEPENGQQRSRRAKSLEDSGISRRESDPRKRQKNR
jgi:hypothetical protein